MHVLCLIVLHFIFDIHNKSCCSQWGSVGYIQDLGSRTSIDRFVVFTMDDVGVVVTSTDPPGGLWDPESHDAEQCTANKCSLCFWTLHGHTLLETMVAKSPDGTQSVAWLFQTPSGVGCRLCSLRYKNKKTCAWRTPWPQHAALL